MTPSIRYLISVKPWLIGEMNPLSVHPRHALFPFPVNCTGWRLCHKILEMDTGAYVRAFERRNLCVGKWSMEDARKRAFEIERESREVSLVLLGRKVATAFGYGKVEFFKTVVHNGRVLLFLPHPSGLCRVWNEPGSYQRARDLVLSLIRY